MTVPLTLLGLLEREPSHGYDLKRDYDAYFGRGKPLPFGQVYATLSRLARDGKVAAGEPEPGSGPDRKRYVITEQGVTEVQAWLTEPVEPEPHLQTVLFAKVVLALMTGRPAETYLDTQRAAHMNRMRGADRPQAHRQHGRRAAGRSRPVPSGGRPALDRPDHGPPRIPGEGGAGMTGINALRAQSDTGAPLIHARDLELSFGQTPALRGASVSVNAGEILAVMGPSGSGKSTLLHCLAGILVPDSGEIHFDGRRIDTLRESERSALRRDRFGFVFQFGQLVPELTAEENVALPLLLSGVRRAQALTQARGWFERLDLDGLQQRRSGELSGGQAQRVALGPRPGRTPRGAVRGRADRGIGLAHRRARHGAAVRRSPRAGHHRHPGHPRAARRRLRRS